MYEGDQFVSIELNPIGVVRSPYRERGDAPRRGRLSETESEILIDEQFVPGLKDLAKNRHLIVLCWFDRADRRTLTATPPGRTVEQGVFATRSPDRPNPIGLSVVDLIEVAGRSLRVRGLDALDMTPVLDIKPYAPGLDSVQ